MSGFAAIARLDGPPVTPVELSPLTAALARRGPRSAAAPRSVFLGTAALAYLAPATPPAAGRRRSVAPQPVSDCGVTLVFDGRLDDRATLAAELGSAIQRGPAPAGDPELVLAAYLRWGLRAFERLLGTFAIALWDGRDHRLVLARDALGEHALVYAHTEADGLLLAASEESLLLAHPAVPDAADETSLLRFLAAEPPLPGHTFLAAIREVPPGCVLEACRERVRIRRYWEPEQSVERSAGGDEVEWVERFRSVLDLAVESSLRGVGGEAGPAAVMLSGGLDSGSIAMLAARRLATDGQPLAAWSWVFDELGECDERPWIGELTAAGGLDAHELVGDSLWPLCDEGSAGRLAVAGPAGPQVNPYRALKQALYVAAQRGGARVLLSGAAGDLLWAASRRATLGSLLAAGEHGAGATEVAAALGAILGRGAWVRLRAWGGPGRRVAAPWLSGQAREQLAAVEAASHAPGGLDNAAAVPPSRATQLLARRRRLLTGPRVAWGSSREHLWALRAGLDLRDPYRDRRLVEMALALPAHLLSRRGEGKYLLRRAMVGTLPTAVAKRQGSAPLEPLFRRGLCEREKGAVDRLLAGGRVASRLVRPEWVAAARVGLSAGRLRGAEAVALWNLIAAESWLESRERETGTGALQLDCGPVVQRARFNKGSMR